MSYNLSLKVEHGFVTLASMSGDVPEGHFDISGHNDQTGSNLQIMRRKPNGTFAEHAAHSHSIEPQESLVAPDENPF